MELGRACIHQDFRKGFIIGLLWRGIAEYMNATNAKITFGCATINTESPRQAALLYHHFARENRFQESSFCPPTANYSMPNLDLWIRNLNRPFSLDEQSEIESLIPPLCRAYLKVGAHLGGEPAWDSDFKCIDFLTILPRENLNKALWRKYNLCPTDNAETSSSVDPAANF